ncbi:hypothetical protein LshimejAT787_2400190 [Lyophyllum shimeji]|uniref:DNA breaking-rejoining enzyme n=1 Tax=Lyophyllum shimeji TaxID=47721 RepID=A0A9P3Q1E5_LYOSH|nr:hypothetical protein LshimejAT787_2400190 [Lyophyllum shimeji]
MICPVARIERAPRLPPGGPERNTGSGVRKDECWRGPGGIYITQRRATSHEPRATSKNRRVSAPSKRHLKGRNTAKPPSPPHHLSISTILNTPLSTSPPNLLLARAPNALAAPPTLSTTVTPRRLGYTSGRASAASTSGQKTDLTEKRLLRPRPPDASPHDTELFERVVHPYNVDGFRFMLDKHNLTDLYPRLLVNLIHGFPLGRNLPRLKKSIVIRNHPSIDQFPSVVQDYIDAELAAGRMSGPFSFEEVERILRGPIHSSPFLVSEQIAGPGLPPKYRVCRNLSKADPVSGMPAINSFIDKDDFPTSFDMALKVAAAVAEAPPGTQGIAFDIKTFHRTCPVLPDHKPYLVASFQGKFYIDHIHPFGARPASSNAGQIGNAAVDIWQAESRSENRLFKYEDDIQNFRYPNPLGRFSDGVFTYFHNRETSLALIDILHIPWHPEKSGICFASTTTFIGFQWDLTLHRVSLPEKKRMKYLMRIESMLSDDFEGKRFTLRQIQQIHGTLVHVCFVFPDGSSRLPVLSNFMSGFRDNIFVKHSLSNSVLDTLYWWQKRLEDPIELAILFLKQLNFYEQRVEVFSDNSGAIGAHSKNRSPNIAINLSVRRSYSVLAECLIVPDFIYIESASNPADPISRGDPASPSLRFLTRSFDMPRELADIFLHEGVHLATSPSTQTAVRIPVAYPQSSAVSPSRLPTSFPPPSDIILSPSSHSALDLFCPIQPSPDISENLHVIRSLAARSLPPCSPRKPRPADTWRPSPLRPIVPADRRVLLWTTPHSEQAQQSLDSTISPRLQRKIFKNLLLATSDSTRQSYGAGLLRFTQFCDREKISENLCMPASTILLSAFIADAIGTCTGNCIRNWLNGLRLWHLYNLADWHGRDRWISSLQKATDIQGVPFKRPPRGPITKDHLRHLHSNLNFATPAHAAIWAAALAAFWGCRRLGELLLRSRSSFSPTRNVTRQANFSHSIVNGHHVISFHLPWTKTTGTRGGDCILTATNDMFCPVTAMLHHLSLNNITDPSAPLFAFRDGTSWSPLTRDHFLKTTGNIYRSANLDAVLGHSYRIGGSLHLLMTGVAPEFIMKIGGWTSLCFLIYWRRLELVIPAAVTRAWAARQREFAERQHLPNGEDDLLFDLNS